MPFLAFDLDAFENCANIAQGCGLRAADVSHGLLSLWRHCWRAKTDHVTTAHLKAFFAGADVCEMLLTFGLIAATELGWRVRGAQKYLDIDKARSDNGKKAAANGNLQRGRQDLKKARKSPAGLQQVSSTGSNSAPALSANSQQPTANSETKDVGLLALQVFAHWLVVWKKNANTVFGSERRSKVEARLREGYSVEDLKLAVDGCAVTPHNRGETDGQIHDDLGLICRSANQVDRFKRNALSPPRPKPQQRLLMADPNQDFPTGVLNASPL